MKAKTKRSTTPGHCELTNGCLDTASHEGWKAWYWRPKEGHEPERYTLSSGVRCAQWWRTKRDALAELAELGVYPVTDGV